MAVKAQQNLKIFSLNGNNASLEQEYNSEKDSKQQPALSDKMIYNSAQILGVNTFFLSLIAFIGHIFTLLGYDTEILYRWAGDVGMAFNTSILFMFTGICLYLLATLIKRKCGDI